MWEEFEKLLEHINTILQKLEAVKIICINGKIDMHALLHGIEESDLLSYLRILEIFFRQYSHQQVQFSSTHQVAVEELNGILIELIDYLVGFEQEYIKASKKWVPSWRSHVQMEKTHVQYIRLSKRLRLRVEITLKMLSFPFQDTIDIALGETLKYEDRPIESTYIREHMRAQKEAAQHEVRLRTKSTEMRRTPPYA